MREKLWLFDFKAKCIVYDGDGEPVGGDSDHVQEVTMNAGTYYEAMDFIRRKLIERNVKLGGKNIHFIEITHERIK